jgi:predicted HicB family RNase H-like nuclease
LRLIPRDSSQKLTVRYSELAHLAFTGRDAAAGKSFETWVKKYAERKAAGDSNIRLDPEKLD